MSELTTEATISQSEDQVFTIVDGEAVLMGISDGRYYRLDDIGTRIWSLIETPKSLSAVCDQLVQEFSVPRETCEADVRGLLERMSKHNLIRLAPGA
jgi:hypothetical protein